MMELPAPDESLLTRLSFPHLLLASILLPHPHNLLQIPHNSPRPTTECPARHPCTSSTSVHQYASLSVCQYAITPVRQYVSTPVCHYASTPVHQYTSMPLRQYASTSLHQYAITPVRQYAIMPVHQYASTPVCHYTFVPTLLSPLYSPLSTKCPARCHLHKQVSLLKTHPSVFNCPQRKTYWASRKTYWAFTSQTFLWVCSPRNAPARYHHAPWQTSIFTRMLGPPRSGRNSHNNCTSTTVWYTS
jgi:hypothetical protein